MKRVLIFLILALVLTGCGSTDALEAQVTDLQQQVSRLEAENEALRAQLAQASTPEQTPAAESAPCAELSVFDWNFAENILTLTDVYARVINLPTADGQILMPQSCFLVIALNDGQIFSEALQLLPGEGDNSLELQIGAVRTELPELAEGDIVETYLEVTLADGSLLTGWGCDWDYAQGDLSMTAG